jgi:hypothetical protein
MNLFNKTFSCYFYFSSCKIYFVLKIFKIKYEKLNFIFDAKGINDHFSWKDKTQKVKCECIK